MSRYTFLMYTIVPLGNNGKHYEKTRHNVARIIVALSEEKIKAIENAEVFIPSCFMNESGIFLKEYMKYHTERDVIIIYDDKDIALGDIRISYDRNDGGHNGVKSVIEHLQTKAFVRVRVGIARVDTEGNKAVAHGEAVQGFVLGIFSEEEMKKVQAVSYVVAHALQEIVERGYMKAMEKYN